MLRRLALALVGLALATCHAVPALADCEPGAGWPAGTACTPASRIGVRLGSADQSLQAAINSGAIGRGLTPRTVTGTATLAAGDLAQVNTTSGAFAVTLPAGPSDGSVIEIVDAAGTFDTNGLTINRGGADTIEGATSKVISTEYAYVRLSYDSGLARWQMLDEAGGGGSGDVQQVWTAASGDVSGLVAGAGDTFDAGAASASSPFTRSTVLPATCLVGQVHQDTDSGGSQLFLCTAANTWSKLALLSEAGGVSDGDKQDITITVGGTVYTIDPGAVTAGKLATDAVSDTSKVATDAIAADEIAAGAVGDSEAAAILTRDTESPAAGDISGSHSAGYQLGTGVVSATELDEAGVEAGLEAVLDLADQQGDLPLGTKTSGGYAGSASEGGTADAALTGDAGSGPIVRAVATGTCPSGWFRDMDRSGASFVLGTDKCSDPEATYYARDYSTIQDAIDAAPRHGSEVVAPHTPSGTPHDFTNPIVIGGLKNANTVIGKGMRGYGAGQRTSGAATLAGSYLRYVPAAAVPSTTTVAAGSAPSTLVVADSLTTNQVKHRWVRLTSGAVSGQMRLIRSVSGSTLTIEPDWTTVPSNGDTYVVEDRCAFLVAGSIGGSFQDFVIDAQSNSQYAGCLMGENLNSSTSQHNTFVNTSFVGGTANSFVVTGLDVGTGDTSGIHDQIDTGVFINQVYKGVPASSRPGGILVDSINALLLNWYGGACESFSAVCFDVRSGGVNVDGMLVADASASATWAMRARELAKEVIFRNNRVETNDGGGIQFDETDLDGDSTFDRAGWLSVVQGNSLFIGETGEDCFDYGHAGSLFVSGNQCGLRDGATATDWVVSNIVGSGAGQFRLLAGANEIYATGVTRTWPTTNVAAEAPPRVTSLPSSPQDGDLVILIAATGKGVCTAGGSEVAWCLRVGGAWDPLDVDDDSVGFDDADSNFAATAVGPAIEELDDTNGAGLPNQTDYKVNWDQIGNMPAGFADETDDGGGGGGSAALDLGDDGANESAGITEIAVTGDANGIFIEPSADKLLIALANDWPKADVADVANTGDSATSFFSTGQIELARGGTGTDTSAFGGSIFGLISGSFTDIDTWAEIASAIGVSNTALDASGNATFRTLTTSDLDGTNFLDLFDNATGTPSCASLITAGKVGLLDSDASAARAWDLCDGTSLLWRFPATSTTTTHALMATSTAGAPAFRALVRGDLSDLGTGVATALGVNVGSAGAFVTFNGALGTPSSGTLTNATGLPISTGVSGLGSGVATFLGTPSSANLRGALTDEVGTGAAMFGLISTMADDLACTGSQVVRRNAGDTAFECATSSAGASVLLDIGDDAANESTAITELATTGDAAGTDAIVDEPSADKVLLHIDRLWPAGTGYLYESNADTQAFVIRNLGGDVEINPSKSALGTGAYQWRHQDTGTGTQCTEIEGSSADASEALDCFLNPTADTTFNRPALGAGTYTYAFLENLSGDATATSGGVLEVTQADALEANGTNCGAGEAAQGIDTAGNAEGCFTPGGGSFGYAEAAASVLAGF